MSKRTKPTPIPAHFRTMDRHTLERVAAGLLEAAKAQVKWFDKLCNEYHPDDTKLLAEIKRIHGPRIDLCRAAIAAGEVQR